MGLEFSKPKSLQNGHLARQPKKKPNVKKRSTSKINLAPELKDETNKQQKKIWPPDKFDKRKSVKCERAEFSSRKSINF